MARPIWTGAISFGLLQVPVQLMPAERRQDLSFRQLDARNHKPIRYQRVNSETGEEVASEHIVKAFEHRKGEFVVLQDEELEQASGDATQSIDIASFVHAADVPPMFFEKPYYLVPVQKGAKGYVLLRETLRKTGYAGLARVVIRTRQQLALLIVAGDALVLNLIRFAEEMVPIEEYELPDAHDKTLKISARELQMAQQLIEAMVSDWNPGTFVDDSRARLQALIERKLKGKGRELQSAVVQVEPEGTNVVDFMAVLKKSLEASRPAAPDAAKASRRRSPAYKGRVRKAG